MGVISYYSKLYGTTNIKQPITIEEPEVVFKGRPILYDAKTITLAEFNQDSKNAITAHHLKDYRRKTFNLVLLPKIDILLDSILEGSEYWNAKLHNESPFS